MLIVATTSRGETNVRDTTPAIAPAARNFKFLVVPLATNFGAGLSRGPFSMPRKGLISLRVSLSEGSAKRGGIRSFAEDFFDAATKRKLNSTRALKNATILDHRNPV
mmetsp:Transcript_17721/g.50626  ORF Transcript_17721/g.50626 Transcript_17721/m.50626 type:complete len:107 (-) Transcript_17721:27-347(-)